MRADRPKFLIPNGFAAFVLMAQLMLAIGHVHYAEAPHRHVRSAIEVSGGHHPPAHPADEHDDATCPLYWIHAAAASLLLPDPPSLPNRHAGATLIIFPPEPQHSATPRAAAFQPRAPPFPALPLTS